MSTGIDDLGKEKQEEDNYLSYRTGFASPTILLSQLDLICGSM